MPSSPNWKADAASKAATSERQRFNCASDLRSIFSTASGAFFGATSIDGVAEFVFWIVSVSMVFGLLGIVIGLWANNFEQLTILNIFFITPLSFVGGVFNTVAMLPPWLRWIAYGNPFFYFINGLRHAMIGFSEASEALGVAIALGLAALMSAIVWRLYAVGYGLRE